MGSLQCKMLGPKNPPDFFEGIKHDSKTVTFYGVFQELL